MKNPRIKYWFSAIGASAYPARTTSRPCSDFNPRVQTVPPQVRNGVSYHLPEHLHQISLFTTRLHPRFTKLKNLVSPNFSPIFDSSSTCLILPFYLSNAIQFIIFEITRGFIFEDFGVKKCEDGEKCGASGAHDKTDGKCTTSVWKFNSN